MEILEILQRLPFPVVNIYFPTLSVPSTMATSIPKSLAVIAAIIPEAPPPTIIKS